jgi:LmbE family N-acetylglucosaminyl deacetylase
MKVLVIAVHPDDETLGCGGTLLKHASQGAELHWVLVTSMQAPEFTPDQIQVQAEHVHAVCAAYPFQSLTWLKLPSLRLDTLPLADLVLALRAPLAALKPDVVYLPNRSDVHSDHRVVAQAAQAVLKSFYQNALGVTRVLAMEVLSETESAAPWPEQAFLPNVFVDTTGTFARKQEILALYTDELHADPLPRGPSAVAAQARLRGATIGTIHAESFVLLREIL